MYYSFWKLGMLEVLVRYWYWYRYTVIQARQFSGRGWKSWGNLQMSESREMQIGLNKTASDLKYEHSGPFPYFC